MNAQPYTLAELARLADVTPRTVRYYVHQGLLPSPHAAGPATRYGDRHLLRLRLIRRLQREHLPLAEIRTRLERMSDEDLEAAVRGIADDPVEHRPSSDETLAFVRTLMTRAGVAPRFYSTPEPPPHGTLGREVPDEFPLRDPSGAEPPEAVPAFRPADPVDHPGPGAPAPSPATPPLRVPLLPARPMTEAPAGDPMARPVADRSTWERISVTPDVEIHVRRPLDRPRNKRVEQLLRIARELFEEHP